MAKYKTLPRSKKKKPDEFISTVDHLIRAAIPHKIWILSAVLIVIVASVGYFIYKQKRGHEIEALQSMMIQATKADDVLREYEKIIEENGSNTFVYFTRLALIEAYKEKGDKEKIITQLEESMDEVPTFLVPVVQASLAQALWSSGKPEEAIQVLDMVDKENNLPSNDYPMFIKAEILLSMNRQSEAVPIYLALSENENSSVQKKAKDRLLMFKLK